MKEVIAALKGNPGVSDYKLNITGKESRELFFVKGRLETARTTETRDVRVTVYVDHDGCKGDSSFPVYPFTTPEDLTRLVEEAAQKALLICNQPYDLPAAETGSFQVESNFAGKSLSELAESIARTVFSAEVPEHGSLNAVEIFVDRLTERVVNSRGLDKTQVRHTAKVEAIPTYNGAEQSVELYQQINFSGLDEDALRAEAAERLRAARSRYEAVKPGPVPPCPVVLNKHELATLFTGALRLLNYSTIYARSGLFRKGDPFQADPTGDRITLFACGEAPGCASSARFDSDGLSLGSVCLIRDGVVAGYMGSNRMGQYLGETPTGLMRCVRVEPGTWEGFSSGSPYLEVLSMSGLQVDPYNDYIGGEVRLALYHDGETLAPVTGISIAGRLTQALSSVRLSRTVSLCDSYAGPDRAVFDGMKVF